MLRENERPPQGWLTTRSSGVVVVITIYYAFSMETEPWKVNHKQPECKRPLRNRNGPVILCISQQHPASEWSKSMEEREVGYLERATTCQRSWAEVGVLQNCCNFFCCSSLLLAALLYPIPQCKPGRSSLMYNTSNNNNKQLPQRRRRRRISSSSSSGVGFR